MTTALPSPALRRLQHIGIPVGALLLTLFFVATGFPYDRVRDVVASKASLALRAQIRIHAALDNAKEELAGIALASTRACCPTAGQGRGCDR
jgi:hypothetical protein